MVKSYSIKSNRGFASKLKLKFPGFRELINVCNNAKIESWDEIVSELKVGLYHFREYLLLPRDGLRESFSVFSCIVCYYNSVYCNNFLIICNKQTKLPQLVRHCRKYMNIQLQFVEVNFWFWITISGGNPRSILVA